MSYHPRIEDKYLTSFITTRTRNCELWFANNAAVEEYALSHLAKTRQRYNAKLYAFGIEGSHYHLLGKFPGLNRAGFCRDYNSGVARAVDRLTPNYNGGGLWQRRYSSEIVATDADVEKQFFYTVLQPVKDGLVSKLSEYPFYNCFHDAIHGREREFEVVDWSRYNSAKRFNPDVDIANYKEIVTLKYERLPGYEHVDQVEYVKIMKRKLEEYRQEILRTRAAENKSRFMGRKALLKVVPGTPAKNPKVSDINSHRARVLSDCDQTREEMKDWYFEKYFAFKAASKRFLAGDFEVEFPPGMYRPPVWMVVRPSGEFSVL